MDVKVDEGYFVLVAVSGHIQKLIPLEDLDVFFFVSLYPIDRKGESQQKPRVTAELFQFQKNRVSETI